MCEGAAPRCVCSGAAHVCEGVAPRYVCAGTAHAVRSTAVALQSKCTIVAHAAAAHGVSALAPAAPLEEAEPLAEGAQPWLHLHLNIASSFEAQCSSRQSPYFHTCVCARRGREAA